MLVVQGEGVLNSLINNIPFELHVPGYQYLGPGTKLQKRLARGDPGINPLDRAARDHDIAYSHSNSLKDRHKADWVLENKAWERVTANDASLSEKATAWLTTTAMKVKRKLGMGMKRGKGVGSFKRHVLQPIIRTLKRTPPSPNLRKSALVALAAARTAVKNIGGKRNVRVPRIIPFESKSGGILPLIPIFAGLSALGSLAGGASAIAKTVIDSKNAQKKLEEDKRHNKAMEHLGKGLYLRKNGKGGFGLYLKKSKNYR
uniref:Uncharacterized protein LOC114329197 n=1 Tax=Diabrotica virgifera virgifera TaxID=50390 RepID=A0A6P7FDE0_DIAVI